MKTIPLEAYLVVSMVLFGLGVFGMIVRRNMVTVLMSMELALNAVN
ncbi:MAG: NADH-quinone oxidoreductase subunit NuoK, partial [Aquificaceae bacterium]